MVKYQKKNISKKTSNTKERRISRRKENKIFNNQKRTNLRNNRISRTKRQKRSISHKSNESIKTFSSESSDEKINPILLPDEILSIAKTKSGNLCDLNILEKAITIYDIDDDIIYKYLDKCGKINKDNMKYIYTLSYQNRKDIIDKYEIKNYIFTKQSKLIFFDFVKFLVNEYNPNDESSKNVLKSFKLENFDKFIIPIFEGSKELKYYYFINVIYEWLQVPNQQDNVKSFLSYFSDFFGDKKTMNKIEVIFYIIFRIDLLFFNNTSEGETLLKNMAPSVLQTLEEIKNGLMLIQDQLEEKIADKKITRRTSFTLKNCKIKFKAFYYVYSDKNANNIINNIKNKNYMVYEYFQNNRFNFFNNEIEKNAFINFVNEILSSNVIKEYYKKVESFKNYEFPFEKEKIRDYLWEKVIFIDLDEVTWGITNREGFGIFINRKKGKNPYGLGYGAYVITVTHEFVGHCIGYLINSNKKCLHSTPTPDQSFISQKDNLASKDLSDGGDKFETLLFGKKLQQLTIGGNHFLLDIENWNLSLAEFKRKFKLINIKKTPELLKAELNDLKRKSEYVKILFGNINYDNLGNNIRNQSMKTRSNDLNDPQSLSLIGKR